MKLFSLSTDSWIRRRPRLFVCVLLAVILLPLAVVLSLRSCSRTEPPEPPAETFTPIPTPEPTPTPTPIPTPETTPTPTPDPYADLRGVNPLTGLPMDEAYENRRPAAVMLNNMKKALPMFGNSQADIIYEAMIEGGITRMVGLYQNPSGVPQIGTVRSTRAYFLDIAQGHDAILLHVGYSDEAKELIRARGLLTLNLLGGYEESLYWRDQERIRTKGLEHSAFTSGERIGETFQKLKSRITHEDGYIESLLFADGGAPSGGLPAGSVSVKFSGYKTGVFDYDPGDQTYAVSQYGEPYIDGQDDSQVRVANVLVLRAATGNKGDAAGHISINLTGEGNGLYANGGRYIPIKWSKRSCADPFVYTREDGTPLYLGRGRTYINIVPINCKIEIG